MKSTVSALKQQLLDPDPSSGWQSLVERFPVALDAHAKQYDALCRQRHLRQASDLLRLILVYSLWDWSLRLSGAWAQICGVGHLSKTAVRYRLRASVGWLGALIPVLLAQRQVHLPHFPGVCVHLRDASGVSPPGSRGTDWRTHVSLDLDRLQVTGIEVTDAHGGESLTRFAAHETDIEVADQGYAYPESLGAILAVAYVVVRFYWRNLRLCDAQGQKWDLYTWLTQACLAPLGSQECRLRLVTPQGTFWVRVLALRLPDDKAEAARRRLRKTAQKKGRTVEARSLEMAAFVLLLTNLPESGWPLLSVFRLYRLRWQIEWTFRRWKQFLTLEGGVARDPQLAQVVLLAKVIGILLTEQLTGQARESCPDWFSSTQRPVNPSRMLRLFHQQLKIMIWGQVELAQLLEVLPDLRRYLCDEPRTRPYTLAEARQWLSELAVPASIPFP
jgi:hypothetical protein